MPQTPLNRKETILDPERVEMLRVRVLSAIVALLIIGPPVLFGGFYAILIITGIIVLLAMNEYIKLTFKADMKSERVFYYIMGTILFVAGSFQFRNLSAEVFSIVLLSSIVSVLIYYVFILKKTEGAPEKAGLLLLGLFYIPLLASYFPALRSLNQGLNLLIYCLLITWMGDTGAYFFGRWFGRKKLCPVISPGKTIVGVEGGLLWALLSSLLCRSTIIKEMPLLHAVVFPLILEFFAITGDLTESIIKRAAGVKDSGKIMPGHGGVLDRIDALLFTVPITYYYGRFFYNHDV